MDKKKMIAITAASMAILARTIASLRHRSQLQVAPESSARDAQEVLTPDEPEDVHSDDAEARDRKVSERGWMKRRAR